MLTKAPADIERPPLNISGSAGIFLDALRLLAASAVLYLHAWDKWIAYGAGQQGNSLSTVDFALGPGGSTAADTAHWAVIVFFVLSGYVIAHVTAGRSTLEAYLIARLSRLYSILIGALLLTALVEIMVSLYRVDLLSELSRGASVPRYLITLLLANELWFLSAAPKINGPLWSLSYELWYYLIYGLWHYRKQFKGGPVLAVVACIVAGPKILVLMPCSMPFS